MTEDGREVERQVRSLALRVLDRSSLDELTPEERKTVEAVVQWVLADPRRRN